MRTCSRGGSILALLAGAGLSLSTAGMGEDVVGTGEIKTYSSPRAVFDAYRNACDKRDWRSAYSCMSPKAKGYAVYEAWTSCYLHEGEPTVVAVLEKFHVAAAEVDDDYCKRYKLKHARDPNAGIAYDENNQSPKNAPSEAGASAPSRDLNTKTDETRAVPIPTQLRPVLPATALDDQLYIAALTARIDDGAGFYEAAKHATQRDEQPKIERMDSTVVHGDTAVGRVAISFIETKISKPAFGREQAVQKSRTRFEDYHFRKLNGSWFLDQ